MILKPFIYVALTLNVIFKHFNKFENVQVLKVFKQENIKNECNGSHNTSDFKTLKRGPKVVNFFTSLNFFF